MEAFPAGQQLHTFDNRTSIFPIVCFITRALFITFQAVYNILACSVPVQILYEQIAYMYL